MELRTDGVGGERADDLVDAPAVIRLDPKWRIGSAVRRLRLKFVKSGPTVAA
jgi:hypothetical protein